VTCLQQVRRNMMAHAAQADKSDFHSAILSCPAGRVCIGTVMSRCPDESSGESSGSCGPSGLGVDDLEHNFRLYGPINR
jgi:hypothetical protein